MSQYTHNHYKTNILTPKPYFTSHSVYKETKHISVVKTKPIRTRIVPSSHEYNIIKPGLTKNQLKLYLNKNYIYINLF